MKKSLYLYVSFLVLGLSLFFIINSVFAWTLPTANPPQGDLPSPLDTSSVEQTKAGNLNLDNNLKVGGLLRLGLYTSHPTGTNGNLYYNTSDYKFYGYQNNEWKELGGGSFWLANGDNIYNTNTGNVGIGTTAPGAKLEVAGQVKITGGSPGANKVLTSDASGLATWQTITGTLPSGTSGQTLRHDGTNWVANSVIYNNGTNVGIGTTSPSQKLHVAGSTQIDGAIVSPEGTLRDDGGGWVRTYGNTGWYSQTYGGGWYMTDSTYLRAYNNKQILAGGGINMNSTKITNLATPTAASDAATKGYVDAATPDLSVITVRMISAKSASTYTLANAINYCRDLSASCAAMVDESTCLSGTFTDWRLPTVEELALFIGNPNDSTHVWTRTPYYSSYDNWIRFNLSSGGWYYGAYSSVNYVRCVR